MNNRERVAMALDHRQPDRLPTGFFADATFMKLIWPPSKGTPP